MHNGPGAGRRRRSRKAKGGAQLSRRNVIKTFGLYVVLIAIAVVMLYPFVWSFTASFKTTAQIYNGNTLDLWPRPFTTANYVRAWTALPFYRFILNSLFLSVIVPFFSIWFAAMAAYSFARLRFRGRDLVFVLLLAVMMMPGHITLIPNYAIVRSLGWINQYEALIIPAIFSGQIVINIFFLRQYLLSVPKELDEAAIIDGCSRFGIWARILMPNAKPALATLVILSFVTQWNAFLWPVVVINDYWKMPVQVGLSYFKSGTNTDWGVLMAGATLSIIPMVIVFLIFQKQFVKGLLTSGFK